MAINVTAQVFEAWETGQYPVALKVIEEKQAEFKTGVEKRLEWQFCNPDELTREDAKLLLLSTGTNYGNNKAILTKMIAGILGYAPEPSDVPKADLEKMLTDKSGIIFEVTVMKEATQSGGFTNRLGAIKSLTRNGEKVQGPIAISDFY